MILFKKILFSLYILSGLVVTGCATNQQKEFLDEKNITIERVDSRSSHIGIVNVTKSKNGFLIRGEIKKHPHTRGPIPGHLDIEIIDKDGKSKITKNVNYKRKSQKSRAAKFNVELNIVLEKNDVIRITHHRG